MKKVELLAPAGSFESFLGAVHAGADAVYIGGRKFGARAYAENFTEEKVCLAIRYAHLFGRRVYLTVNTLVKEAEMTELPEYIRPFYEEGLDGVIVQDLGVFSLLRQCFPGMELHGSTQMTVTGARGAGFLMEQGASRVVPARELSLEEIRRIKAVGIEVEAFIHGAMCYCYSGQCLFSSMLGGRSGNRGRCAQPCRLPYRIIEPVSGCGGGRMPGDGGVAGKKAGSSHPLSLKDMCTLAFIPELIGAGIDSFKIEGRMKRPEYAAGVTAIYRKYIDRYYAAPGERFEVSEADAERLRSLYIRSEIQDGYYHRHNGREMITPDKPGYSGTDETYLHEVREAYLNQAPKIPVRGQLVLKKEEPAVLALWTERGPEGRDGPQKYRISQKGQTVQAAQRQPLTEASAKKQLCKTGNTPFVLERLTIDMEADLFLPVRSLNDLRRDALAALEEAIWEPYRAGRRIAGENCEMPAADAGEQALRMPGEEEVRPYLAAQIVSGEQLAAVCSRPETDRLYVDGDLLIQDRRGEKTGRDRTGDGRTKEVRALLTQWKAEREGRSLFLVMPYVIRLRDEGWLERPGGELFLEDTIWDGVLIRNLESLYWLKEKGYAKEIRADAGLYVWNRQAKAFFHQLGVSMTAPLECSKEELSRLGIRGMEVIVYGRSTLMVTANCVRKTGMECRCGLPRAGGDRALSGDWLMLRDRYGTDFPVRTVCPHCYNEIYNSVSCSLHEYGRSVMQERPSGVRLVFTTETAEEIRDVYACYGDFTERPDRGRKADFSYTKGHYKRGAE